MEIKAINYCFAVNMPIRVYGSNGCSKRSYMALTSIYGTRRTRPE